VVGVGEGDGQGEVGHALYIGRAGVVL
jgi:hypothetical protein